MCFFKKRFKQLENQIKNLQDIIEKREIERLQNIEKQHTATISDLQNVKFKVKSAVYSEQERSVVIKYDIPPIVLKIDDNGKPELNKTFRSINMLNLVGMDDFKKIQNVLNSIKPIDNDWK